MDLDFVVEVLDGFDRNVFELVGDNVETARKPIERSLVIVGTCYLLNEMTGRGIEGRIEKSETQPERVTGKRQHATELTAAKDSDFHFFFLGSE